MGNTWKSKRRLEIHRLRSTSARVFIEPLTKRSAEQGNSNTSQSEGGAVTAKLGFTRIVQLQLGEISIKYVAAILKGQRNRIKNAYLHKIASTVRER